MKKKIHFFIVSYFLFLLVSVISCTNCKGNHHNSYKVIHLTGTNKKIANPYNWMDFQLKDIKKNSVMFNEFAIKIDFEKESYIALKQSVNILNSAYACSILEPKTLDIVKNIEIISTVDFNSNYTAGTNLASLFDLIVVDHEHGITSHQKLDVNTYLLSKPKAPNQLILILKEAPEVSKKFQFLIKYYQKGKEFNYTELTTNPVEITV